MRGNLCANYSFQPHYKEDETSAFPVYEDLSDTPDEEDIENESEDEEDEEVAGIMYSLSFFPFFYDDITC